MSLYEPTEDDLWALRARRKPRRRRSPGALARLFSVLALIAAWIILMAGLAFADDGATTLQVTKVYDAQDVALLILVAGLVIESIVWAIRGK